MEASTAPFPLFIYYATPWKHGASTLDRLCNWQTLVVPIPSPLPRFVIEVAPDPVADALGRPGGPWHIELIVGPIANANIARDFAREWASGAAQLSHPRRIQRARELAGACSPPLKLGSRCRRPGGASADEEREWLPEEGGYRECYDMLLEKTRQVWLEVPDFVTKNA